MLIEEVVFDVGVGELSFAGPTVGAGVSGVVPPHQTLIEQVKHFGACVGIDAPAALAGGIKSIHIHFVIYQRIAAIVFADFDGIVGLLHVDGKVFVVGHIHHIVFPRPIVGTGYVFDEFVDRCASFAHAFYRKSAHGNVEVEGGKLWP